MFLNLLGGAEESGSQSYVPPDGKDDRALKEALDLLRGTITDALKQCSRDPCLKCSSWKKPHRYQCAAKLFNAKPLRPAGFRQYRQPKYVLEHIFGPSIHPQMHRGRC